MENWFEELIENRMNVLQAEGQIKNRFSIKAITHVPYIKFPNLNDFERLEIQEQAKSVLRNSYTFNNCNEVAITYNINEKNTQNKYIIVKGNICSVNIGDDEKTKRLFTELESSEDKELVIACIHNYTNESFFQLWIWLFLLNIQVLKLWKF